MSEIIFEVREAEEGGLWARALGHSIFTQGEDWNDLRTMVKDAVTCHFEKETERPKVIRFCQSVRISGNSFRAQSSCAPARNR